MPSRTRLLSLVMITLALGVGSHAGAGGEGFETEPVFENACWSDWDCPVNYTCEFYSGVCTYVKPPLPSTLTVEGFLAPVGVALVTVGEADLAGGGKALHARRGALPLALRVLDGDAELDDGALVERALPPPTLAAVQRVAPAGSVSEVIDIEHLGQPDVGTAFLYTGNRWTYNLATPQLEAGTYLLTVQLPDGSFREAALLLR
jgi:hypothetical protein